ncbi:DUF2256 domain-containing protein [Mucilaginibacter aquaedulcis]
MCPKRFAPPAESFLADAKKWEKVWDEVKFCSDRCRRCK